MDKNHNGTERIPKADAPGDTGEMTASTIPATRQPTAYPKIHLREVPSKENGWIRKGALSIILCADSIRKTRFLGMLADMTTEPVCYLDTDLLYAGCTKAGLCRANQNTTILCPDGNTWHRDLARTISKASSKKMMIVIDSLNGVYEMFGGPNAAMSANAHIMVLASLAAQSGSSVVMGAVARKRRGEISDTTNEKGPKGGNDGDGDGDDSSEHPSSNTKKDTLMGKMPNHTGGSWVMHPGGRRVPKIAKSRTYLLKGTSDDPTLTATTL